MKILILLFLAVMARFALATAEVGQSAPDFSLTGSDGKVHKLSEFKGKKVIVLEWFNEGCPYVRKHYESGNMQRLQGEMVKNDVIWFTIASSAKGKQGYVGNAEDASKIRKEKKMENTAFVFDLPGSKTAHEYDVKTTPHMFVINKKGLIAYNGAIDSEDNARPIKLAEYVKSDSIKKYVEDAVAAAKKGEDPKVASRDPYGCSLKY